MKQRLKLNNLSRLRLFFLKVVKTCYYDCKKYGESFMGSLKDALLKAGLKETVSPKAHNQREEIAKKKKTEAVVHQEQRNYCEECQQVLPDVELYHHRNPTTEAEWICVKCADRLKIPDTCRKTAQSDTSIKRMFRREHGATLSPDAIKIQKSDKKGPVNGNR
jgi:RNase P subunit RPR2